MNDHIIFIMYIFILDNKIYCLFSFILITLSLSCKSHLATTQTTFLLFVVNLTLLFPISCSYMLSVFLLFQSKCIFLWRSADEMVLCALTLLETSTSKISIVFLYSAHNSAHMPRLVRAKAGQQSQLWLEIEFNLTVMLACHQLQYKTLLGILVQHIPIRISNCPVVHCWYTVG